MKKKVEKIQECQRNQRNHYYPSKKLNARLCLMSLNHRSHRQPLLEKLGYLVNATFFTQSHILAKTLLGFSAGLAEY